MCFLLPPAWRHVASFLQITHSCSKWLIWMTVNVFYKHWQFCLARIALLDLYSTLHTRIQLQFKVLYARLRYDCILIHLKTPPSENLLAMFERFFQVAVVFLFHTLQNLGFAQFKGLLKRSYNCTLDLNHSVIHRPRRTLMYIIWQTGKRSVVNILELNTGSVLSIVQGKLQLFGGLVSDPSPKNVRVIRSRGNESMNSFPLGFRGRKAEKHPHLLQVQLVNVSSISHMWAANPWKYERKLKSVMRFYGFQGLKDMAF